MVKIVGGEGCEEDSAMWVIFGTGACTRESLACFEPDFFCRVARSSLKNRPSFFSK